MPHTTPRESSDRLRATLAIRLKEAMSAQKLSQPRLAALSGLSQPTISSLLRGNRGFSLRTLERLATALRLDVLDLLPPTKPAVVLTKREAAILEFYRDAPLHVREAMMELVRKRG